jgi:hypothetical protein
MIIIIIIITTTIIMDILRFTGLILPVTDLSSLPVTRHVFAFLSAYNIITAKFEETDGRVDMYLTLLFVGTLCTLLSPPSEMQDYSKLATFPVRSSEVWEPHNRADTGKQLL